MKSWNIALLRHNYIRLFLLILIILIALVITMRDRLTPIPQDQSILSQSLCKIPCWHGITPGKSTITEVVQIIKTDLFITSSSHLSEAADGTGRTGIRWSYNGYDKDSRILYENGVVYSISINPNFLFSLQDIISKYGEPTAVNASLGYSMENGVVDAVLALYYPKIGLEVGFPIEGGSVLTTKQFNIGPSIQGASFTLVAPKNSLRDFVAEVYPIQGDELSHILANMTLGWPRFNSLIVINPKSGVYYESNFIVTATPIP